MYKRYKNLMDPLPQTSRNLTSWPYYPFDYSIFIDDLGLRVIRAFGPSHVDVLPVPNGGSKPQAGSMTVQSMRRRPLNTGSISLKKAKRSQFEAPGGCHEVHAGLRNQDRWLGGGTLEEDLNPLC